MGGQSAPQGAPLRLGLWGASGRMGRAIQALLAREPGFAGLTLVAAPDRAAAHARSFAQCDVVVDFATAEATPALLEALANSPAALVTGVTGRDAQQSAAVRALGQTRAVFEAANFSVGLAVLSALVRRAAQLLPADFDAEIFEIHHRQKQDAPSGTALRLGQAVAQGRGEPWPEAQLPARAGLTGPRPEGGVGLAALRGGQVVGEHTVFFFGPAERIELSHRAQDREIFAFGALKAAIFIAKAAPGCYGMADLLGLSGEHEAPLRPPGA